MGVLVALIAFILSAETTSLLHARDSRQAGLPARRIMIGDTITGNLTIAGAVDRYFIFGNYGDALSLGAFPESGQVFPLVMTVFAPNGDVLFTNAGNRAAAAFALPVTVSGAYIFTVRAAQSNQIGAYTLFTAEGAFLRELDGEALRPSQPAQGTLPQIGDRQAWRIDLRAGMLFNVAAQPSPGSQIDPVIEVIGPDGQSVATAHDLSDANSARTSVLPVAIGGTYQVLVSAYQYASLGAYTVQIQIISATAIPPGPRSTAQPIFIEITAEVVEGARYNMIFQGVQAQIVRIDVQAVDTSTQFDPMVELYGPSGRRVAIADDSAGNANAVIMMALDDGDGIYTVKVSGYALLAGRFKLRVTGVGR